MQQVHNERYDFTRFTYLGHRRLFSAFDEIDSGASCGPGWRWRGLIITSFLVSPAQGSRAAL